MYQRFYLPFPLISFNHLSVLYKWDCLYGMYHQRSGWGIVSHEMKNEKITVSTSIESIQCAKGLYLHRCEQSMIALIYLSDSYNGMFPSFWSCPKSFKITL